MKHKQCSTHIKMLFVFSLSRSPVPPCQFPGSDIYTNMISFLYLSTNYEEFVNDERFAIFISTLNCKLHTLSCYFFSRSTWQISSKLAQKILVWRNFNFFFRSPESLKWPIAMGWRPSSCVGRRPLCVVR